MEIEQIILEIGFIFLVLSFVLSCYPLIKGPQLTERAIGLNQITVVVIAIFTGLALFWRDALHLELGMILSLVSFLSSVVIARFLIHRQAR